MSSNGKADYDSIVERPVMILSDKPAAESQEVIQTTAALIDCAVNNRLVAVVCKHNESRKDATILCAVSTSPDNNELAEYIPLAILFTGEDTPWEAYIPPASARVVEKEEEEVQPIVEFSEPTPEVSDDSEQPPAETT